MSASSLVVLTPVGVPTLVVQTPVGVLKRPAKDDGRTPVESVEIQDVGRTCMICDDIIHTQRTPYLNASNRNINRRVRHVVAAPPRSDPDDPHPHSNYICRSCFRLLERIEKGMKLRINFTANYNRSYDRFASGITKSVDTSYAKQKRTSQSPGLANQLSESPGHAKQIATSPGHGEKPREYAPPAPLSSRQGGPAVPGAVFLLGRLHSMESAEQIHSQSPLQTELAIMAQPIKTESMPVPAAVIPAAAGIPMQTAGKGGPRPVMMMQNPAAMNPGMMAPSMPSMAPSTISHPPASNSSAPKPKGRPKVVVGKIMTGGKEEACFFCSHCSQAFNAETLAQEHIKTHMPPKPFRCGQCGEEFASKLGVLSHMEQHVIEKNYPCDRCDEKFAFHCVLCMHKRTIHRKMTPMTCIVCGKKIFGNSYMEIHMRRHAELKPFKCKSCKKGFVTEQDLKQHRRVHTGEKPYECPQCHRCFSVKANCDNHVKRHQVTKTYSCEICLNRFNARSSLKSHMMKKHKVELPSRIKCQFCVGSFTLLRKAVEHMQDKHAIDYQRLTERLQVEKDQANAPPAQNDAATQRDHTYAYDLMLHKARFNKGKAPARREENVEIGDDGTVNVKEDPDADEEEIEDKMAPLSDDEGEEMEDEEDDEFVKIKDEPESDEDSAATEESENVEMKEEED